MSLYDQNNFYYCRFKTVNIRTSTVYTTKTISTIVDCILRFPSSRRVYTTKTISTIVDKMSNHGSEEGLYDQNNFYYCRCSYVAGKDNDVYTTKTISTIVDTGVPFSKWPGLYDQNNFYYCRSATAHVLLSCVYTTKTISTIVDRKNWQNIPTASIRPKQFLLLQIMLNALSCCIGLYDQNNFYYCRYEPKHQFRIGVYTTKTISTIVDSQKRCHVPLVYTTKTISTIVDGNAMMIACMLSIRPKQFLLLQIKFSSFFHRLVYTTKTISTIVDKESTTISTLLSI